jgi:hypothetical protein
LSILKGKSGFNQSKMNKKYGSAVSDNEVPIADRLIYRRQ